DGVVVAHRNGAGALADPGPVPDGVHAYTVRQTDANNLVSPQSAATSVTVDTKAPTAPAAPGINPADDSGVQSDGLTNVAQPRLVGTVEPLGLVQLIDAGGNVVASVAAGADGSYS